MSSDLVRVEEFTSPVRYDLKSHLDELSKKVLPRTRGELDALNDDAYVTARELAILGYSRAAADKHSEGVKGSTPHPLTGRKFRTGWDSSKSGKRNRVDLRTWRIGDLRDVDRQSDHWQPPAGMKPLLDVATKTKIAPTTIRSLIKLGLVRYARPIGVRWGKARGGFKIWHVDPESVKAAREFMIEDRKFYPLFVAATVAGVPVLNLWRWTPKEFGGKGRPCGHIGGISLEECRPHKLIVDGRASEEIVAYSDREMRRIAEARRTGRLVKKPSPAGVVHTQMKRNEGKAGRRPLTDDELERREEIVRWGERAMTATSNVERGKQLSDYCQRMGIAKETYLKWQSSLIMRDKRAGFRF